MAVILLADFGVVAEEIAEFPCERIHFPECVYKTSALQHPVKRFSFPIMEISLVPLVFSIPTIPFSVNDIHVTASYDSVLLERNGAFNVGVELTAAFHRSFYTWIGVRHINVEQSKLRIAKNGPQYMAFQVVFKFRVCFASEVFFYVSGNTGIRSVGLVADVAR